MLETPPPPLSCSPLQEKASALASSRRVRLTSRFLCAQDLFRSDAWYVALDLLTVCSLVMFFSNIRQSGLAAAGGLVLSLAVFAVLGSQRFVSRRLVRRVTASLTSPDPLKRAASFATIVWCFTSGRLASFGMWQLDARFASAAHGWDDVVRADLVSTPPRRFPGETAVYHRDVLLPLVIEHHFTSDAASRWPDSRREDLAKDAAVLACSPFAALAALVVLEGNSTGADLAGASGVERIRQVASAIESYPGDSLAFARLALALAPSFGPSHPSGFAPDPSAVLRDSLWAVSLLDAVSALEP